MRTKYVGRPYRCRRCEQAATLRWWWLNTAGGPPFAGPIKVAYFCSKDCAAGYLYRRNLYTVWESKNELLSELLTLTLIG